MVRVVCFLLSFYLQGHGCDGSRYDACRSKRQANRAQQTAASRIFSVKVVERYATWAENGYLEASGDVTAERELLGWG